MSADRTTTICRCWALTRRDGQSYGFTDHDAPLAFEGIAFRPEAGMTARALVQTTGLAVDNTEALGVLSDAAITEDDIAAGRFDDAGIRVWRVDWAAPETRRVVFRGSLGEIRRAGGAFHAELRGLSAALNVPQGRIYQATCDAVLGDADCGFDLTRPGFRVEEAVISLAGDATLRIADAGGQAAGFFAGGRLRATDGAAAGLTGWVRHDTASDGVRELGLWDALPGLAPGDRVRVEAGCDKRAATCRDRFDNFANFRGFPHIPGEDWLLAAPRGDGPNDGGSMNR